MTRHDSYNRSVRGRLRSLRHEETRRKSRSQATESQNRCKNDYYHRIGWAVRKYGVPPAEIRNMVAQGFTFERPIDVTTKRG